MKTVIITGASSGLGREFFHAAAKRFPDAEFWLIARREDKLRETAAAAPGVKTRIIPADLASDEGLGGISALLEAERPELKLLVNNAGFGRLGNVGDIDPIVQRDMATLNCGSLAALSAMAVGYMGAGSCIVNVASIAAFVPTPRMSDYCSTKAFVLSFSKSMREEYRKKGINVLAVCPGPMTTEFLGVAGITAENSKTFATLPYCNAASVAEKALAAAMRGCAVYTNRFIYKFYRVLSRIIPHGLFMKFTKC